MSGETLKSCPFCGSEARLENGAPNDPSDWVGYCQECDFSLDFKPSQSEAVTAWNTRAEPDNTALVEALKVAHRHIVALWTGIARSDAEAGKRFADNDPVVQQIKAALKAAGVSL